MSRVIPIALAANLTGPTPTVAWAVKITRADTTVYGFTSADRDVTIAAVPYLNAPGLNVESLAKSAGLAVDNTEVIVLADDALITRDGIAAGLWEGAAFEIFQYNWASPADGILVHTVGKFGNLQPKGESYVAELRDLRQVLQPDYTLTTQETCRNRFCDFPGSGVPSHCRLDVADFTLSLTVTSVASQSQFTDTVRIEDVDAFTAGVITWLTGLNAGLRVRVRAFAGGTFQLARPMVFPIEVGDTGNAVLGCAGTRAACIAYGNQLNFNGEPDKPLIDDLTAVPEF